MKKRRKSKLRDCVQNWCEENNKTTFRAGDIPCLTSKSFISKHRVGNPSGYTEYFTRISRGVYKLY